MMDGMEEYTINDDLQACGLPDDDEDGLSAGTMALFGSFAAPINLEAGDAAAGDGGVGTSQTPTGTATPTTSTSRTLRRYVRHSPMVRR